MLGARAKTETLSPALCQTCKDDEEHFSECLRHRTAVQQTAATKGLAGSLLVGFAQQWAAALYIQQSFQVAFISSRADKAYPSSLVYK